MADNEVKLVLTAEDNISSAIKKVTEALGETGLGQAVTAVSTSFTALKGVAELVGEAIHKVNEFVMEGVNDASNAENVNKRLAMSMSLVGQYSDKAMVSVNEWAGALETATGTSDESLRSLVALGLQRGLSIEQSKKATQAAMDLAAATGQDLDTAFQQMTMTMSGSAGRLAKMVPELRNLTKEELENGGAIDLISKKYAGFADNAANSYSGSIAKFHSQIGNVKEELGRLIAQNPVVIASFNAMAETLGKVTEAAAEMSTWLLTNSDDIADFAKAMGIASLVVGAYVVYLNAATIAATLATAASIGFAGVMAIITSPITLTIAAIAALGTGLYFLMKNIDLVVGALKFGLGKALEWILIPLQMYVSALGTVVGIFNADWGKALDAASEKIKAFSKDLQKSGQAQMDAAIAAKEHGKAVDTNALMVARSTAGLTNQITAQAQALTALRAGFAKALDAGKTAFDALKDLSPRMSLEMFQQDAKTWTKSIAELKKQSEGLKVRLQTEVQTDDVKKELEKVTQQIRFSAEAEKALKIKYAIESRTAVTKEEQIRLDQVKNSEISVANEVMQMRLSNAKGIRDQLIAIDEQRILKLRGLESLDAQAGVTAKTQAILNVNKIELDAYKASLDAQKQMAISVESQKQLELASLKASLMSGSTAGGGAAKQDVEVIQAQQKQAQLQVLRDQNKITESAYQGELTQIQIDAINSRTAMEVQLNEQRAAVLGTSPEALALRLQNAQLQNDAELAVIQEKWMNEEMTDAEFYAAQESAEQQHQIAMNGIKEAQLQKEVENQTKLKNTWQATLANLRLMQEQHGKVMGTVKAIQQSQEFQGLNTALSNTATLMQSKNASQFRIGQAAAIAQAAINIPLSAINAYTSMSAIPIIGPALGVAAAAAAIAAGAMQISQIRAQKPPGQAHAGLESVPGSMDNSTFLLRAGERVVAPEQNKDLGLAIDKINSGGSGGHTVNIVINGNADESTVEKIKTAVMDALREKSERGVPVINARGIVTG
jgi:hypothetical protein